jgi:hypothetical protein
VSTSRKWAVRGTPRLPTTGPWAFCMLVVLTLCACGDGEQVSTPGFSDSELDQFTLEVLPSTAERFTALLRRPDEPFIAMNLLAFREEAAGEAFEGLSGREAYLMYVDGFAEAQRAIGTRVLMSGDVTAQIEGLKFDVKSALLASPRAA